MIKQISELSVSELSDLNSNCKFVMDDSNNNTKYVSFSVIESKLSSVLESKLSSYSQDLSGFVKLSANNVFTGNNTLSGTTKVPSGKKITADATLSEGYIIRDNDTLIMNLDGGTASYNVNYSQLKSSLENSFDDKLDILLEKLDSLESRVMNYEGNMNCLDYGSTLSFRLDKGKNLSSDSMPYDCQLQFPYRNGYRYGNYLSVDGYAMEDKMIQATSSMYYCNIACGQDVFFNNHITSDYLNININIIPYQYGRIGNNTDISTLNLQDLKENSIFHITRCLYAGPNSNGYLTSFTQLTDFENTDIYEKTNFFLKYNLVIELSSSRNSIINMSDLDTPYIMTTQNGRNVKPSTKRTYGVYNEILPESTKFSSVANKDIIPYNSIVVSEGQFIYLKYIISYYNSQWVKYPSFNELFNGNAYIGPLNIHII